MIFSAIIQSFWKQSSHRELGIEIKKNVYERGKGIFQFYNSRNLSPTICVLLRFDGVIRESSDGSER